MPHPAKVIVEGVGNWVHCHEFDGSKPVLLGRSSQCDVQLKNMQVSGQHARIAWQGDAYWIEDLGSSNSTTVNGKPLSGKHRLSHHDTIEIEPYHLVFQVTKKITTNTTLAGATIDELLAFRRAAREAQAQALADSAPAALQTDAAQPARRVALGAAGGGGEKAPGLPPLAAAGATAEEKAQRQARRLEAQVAMLRALVFATDANDAFQAMLDIANRMLQAEVGFLMLVNPETQQWEVVCKSRGFEDHMKADASGHPVSLSLVNFAMQRGKATLTEDMPADVRDAAQSLLRNQISTGIAAPVLEGNKVVGCFYVDRREKIGRAYDAEDAADAASLAEAFGDAVQHRAVRRAAAAAAASAAPA